MNDFCLKPGTVLRSPKRNYKVVKELGHGGFGITYLVEGVITDDNISFTTRFALKEHFINTMCSRDPLSQRVVVSQPAQQEVERSLRAFIAEAQRLKELGISHPNIVKVNEVFEANGTAYFVMEYLDSGSLADYVKQRGRLSFEEMAALMEPVCNCVALLHRNSVAHYDIKPQNIMLVNSDGQLRPVLIDFGLAKHYDGQGNATSSIAAAGYTPGYAPVEQYGGFTTFQPTADVYALGATMLFCLTGHAPVRSQELRIADVRDELRNLNLSTSVVNALLPALEYRPDDRPADAAALAAAMFQSAAPSYIPSQSTVKMQPQQQATAPLNRPMQSPAIAHPASATRPEQPTTARPNWLRPTLIAAGIVLVAILGYTLLPDGGTTTDIAMADSVRVETIRVEAPAVVVAPTTEDKPVQQPQQQQQQQPQRQQPQQETLTAAQMYQKGRAYYDNKQYTEAVPWFRKAADQGNADAQCNLGLCYEKGQGVTQSYADAVYWYRKAADQGQMHAQYDLGLCYEYGKGVAPSKSEALTWYRKAAAQGNSGAKEAVQRLESEGYR